MVRYSQEADGVRAKDLDNADPRCWPHIEPSGLPQRRPCRNPGFPTDRGKDNSSFRTNPPGLPSIAPDTPGTGDVWTEGLHGHALSGEPAKAGFRYFLCSVGEVSGEIAMPNYHHGFRAWLESACEASCMPMLAASVQQPRPSGWRS